MRAALVAAGLLVASCAITPEPTKLPELEGVPASFEMSGRLAVRQADRSDIAKLTWSHTGASDLWIIASPLGNEVARIESTAQGAELRQAAGSPVSAPDFPSLTERLLGVPLDPRQLAAWLHGADGASATGGWVVEVSEKQKAGAVDIARLITAKRGDVSVRLVVDQYHATGR